MIRGARTSTPRIAFHDLVGLLEMRFGPLDQPLANFRQRALGNHLLRIVAGDAGKQQAFARQIQPAEARVFIDVAQDIGQLQRAAEVMGEQDAVILGQAEHPDRQTPDGAGNAIAIQIERRHIRRTNVLWHVHLHAVDDREKILALEAEGFHRGGVILQTRRRMTVI